MQASQKYADFEPQINLWLTLFEIALLVFILWQSKRRFQFGLRTLLSFVTLFAIVCSWFAVKLQQAKRQREAVEALLQLGGYVGYDHPFWYNVVIMETDSTLQHLVNVGGCRHALG